MSPQTPNRSSMKFRPLYLENFWRDTMPPTGTGYTGLPSRNAPTNSYNTSHMKLLLDTSNTEPQTQSSLFSRIPGEIRNHIFDLALTAYPGKQEPLYKNAYYCRPGFRYADMKIDTALLLTCRRAYREARLVPLHNYEHVSWSEFRCAPSVRDAKRCPIDSRSGDIYPWVPSLYLFAARGYLEDIGWRIYVRDPRVLALKDLRSLKITIRHCDWNSFETGYPLELDAKQEPMPLATRRSTATDEFQKKSWGRQFLVFKGLKKLELELETIEERREEIDGIITRAADWRFPLQHGNVFVMNPARTKKTGWHGVRHPTARNLHIRRDPKEAKARLVKDGIDFIAWDGEPVILDDNCLTCYVVSLIYEAQPASGSA